MSVPLAANHLRPALLAALAAATGRDVNSISDETVLADLEVDSLALASVILDIEDATGSELPADVLARISAATSIHTVGDLAQLLGLE